MEIIVERCPKCDSVINDENLLRCHADGVFPDSIIDCESCHNEPEPTPDEDGVERCYSCHAKITWDNYRMFEPCPYAKAMSRSGEYNPPVHMCSKCYGDRVGDI